VKFLKVKSEMSTLRRDRLFSIREAQLVCCVILSTVHENNELPADFDEEFFREIHQKGGMMKLL